MAASIVTALTRELHDLHQQVDTVEERVTDLESSKSATDTCITTLELEQQTFLVEVQLRLDEENHSRQPATPWHPGGHHGPRSAHHSDSYLKPGPGQTSHFGIGAGQGPQTAGPEGTLLLPPEPSSPDFLRDMLCRVHFFTITEEILHLAWSRAPIDFDGAMIRIYPYVSRQTQAL